MLGNKIVSKRVSLDTLLKNRGEKEDDR